MPSRRNTNRTESNRRLKHAAVAAVLVAMLAVLVACQHSPRAQASQKGSTTHAAFKRRLSFGMTKKQVLRVLGRPKIIRGNYWYWPVVNGKLAGKPLVAFNNNRTFVVQDAEQFRILFFYGVVQNEEFQRQLPNGHKEWDGILI